MFQIHRVCPYGEGLVFDLVWVIYLGLFRPVWGGVVFPLGFLSEFEVSLGIGILRVCIWAGGLAVRFFCFQDPYRFRLFVVLRYLGVALRCWEEVVSVRMCYYCCVVKGGVI